MDHKNPYELCAKVLVATETSEERWNGFLYSKLGKQSTYLISVSHCHQFWKSNSFHKVIGLSSPDLDGPHVQLNLLSLKELLVSQCDCYEAYYLIGHL